MEDKEFIVTSDLNVAASLYTLGVPIKGMYPRPNSDIVDFYIEKTPENDKRIQDYYGGRLRVNPQEFEYIRKEMLNSINRERKNDKSSQK
jgi:ClpP class serine protease